MGAIRGQFGGLNTDLPFGKVPSGTARSALNVTVRNGKLQKRAGFSEYEDDLAVGADAILNMWSVPFADGDVYLVAKVNDSTVGKLFYARIYRADTKATVAPSWTAMTWPTFNPVFVISATEPGWAFMWRDRFHYFDSTTGTYAAANGVRWNPDVNSAVAYRAGMAPGERSDLVAAGAGLSGFGEKVGNYHVHVAYRNSTTQEEGIVSGPCQAGTGYCTTRPSSGTGAIAVTAVAALPAAYEVDGRHAYCTMGNTESLEDGGNSVECFSYRAYPDAILNSSAALGLNKADHVLSKEPQFTNAGGIPPGASCGTWTGQHAIYGGIKSGATIIGGKIQFSIPGFPTSVPIPVSYNIQTISGGVDSKTFYPKPWVGEAFFDGTAVSIRSAGGLVALYTPSATYQLRASSTGKLFPIKVHGSFGCISALSAAAAGSEIHALGNRSWTITRMDGVGNLANERFTATLAEIPVAYQHLSSMAYYGYQDQVWAAVTKTGGTVPQRILVWDRPRQALVAFDPSCLAAGEGINAMCEVSVPNETPFMLMATSTGRLLKYPVGTSDNGTDFAANWTGVFAVERSQYAQRLTGIELQTGANCKDGVTCAVRVKRAGADSAAQTTQVISRDSGLEKVVVTVDKVDGRMIELDLSSSASYADQWSVEDVVIKTERTDTKQ